MDEIEDFAAWPGELEVRQRGGARTMSGRFPYNKRATVRDRGRVRKESIRSRAFGFAIDDETRKIDLLVGHDFNRPIANRQTGSLIVADADDAVTFTATIGDDPPSWVLDAERSIRAGTMTGLVTRLSCAAEVRSTGRRATDTRRRQSRRTDSRDTSSRVA